MLDHIILTVSDVVRSLAFYEAALKPLNIKFFMPYEGKDGAGGPYIKTPYASGAPFMQSHRMIGHSRSVRTDLAKLIFCFPHRQTRAPNKLRTFSSAPAPPHGS
jgi:catechol 2,3-dioxygenase-like lactoylglutathione lyase family enzyme